ncbi:MAG: hypothetical protein ACREHD_04840, partial [Pirellulales bacterium]
MVYNFAVAKLECYAVGRGCALVHNINGAELEGAVAAFEGEGGALATGPQVGPPAAAVPGVGTQAVLPANSMRPVAGAWAAVEKNGTVFVHYMHNQAAAMANGGVFGPVSSSGIAWLDGLGKVIRAIWDVP